MSMHPIAHAATRPDHPAVIMTGSGKQITYGEMEAESNRFAHLLRARGINQGDAFAVLLENRIEYFTLIWGSQRAGTMMRARPVTVMSPRVQVTVLPAWLQVPVPTGCSSPPGSGPSFRQVIGPVTMRFAGNVSVTTVPVPLSGLVPVRSRERLAPGPLLTPPIT